MDEVVRSEELTKRFGAITAVDGVSFGVRRGEVFGILGPNGAGKTTTLECIEGLQAPTGGRTVVLGTDTAKEPDQVKERIGIQLQASAYFEDLTLTEILDLFGRMYQRRTSSQQLLEMVDLPEKADTTVGKLSGGQRQRFSIAAALINDPEVVFLDEPTTGLDPQARQNLWGVIRALREQGRTVVLTSHYMEEAQELCDRIAIMDQGKVVALDSPSGLIRNLPVPYHIKLDVGSGLGPLDLERLGAVSSVEQVGDGRFVLGSADATSTLADLFELVNDRGLGLESLEVVTATLEDVFLALTGRTLRE